MSYVLPTRLTDLKAIFFDLDDVLVFSEATHTQAWQLSLQKEGVNPHDIDFHRFAGVCDMRQAQEFKTLFKLTLSPEQLFENKRNAFLSLLHTGLEAPPGRDDFLTMASQTYLTAIVSSSVQTVVHAILAAEKIANFFQFVIAYEDCPQHKPDPLPYQQALRRAGIAPTEALVIEDSVSGITSAQQAEIPVIGLRKNQRPDQILTDVPYFNNFTEIASAFFAQLN